MAQQRDFGQEAAQLIIKKSISFFGYTVFLEHFDSNKIFPPPAVFDSSNQCFTIMVPFELDRHDEIHHIAYVLGIVEHHIMCVL